MDKDKQTILNAFLQKKTIVFLVTSLMLLLIILVLFIRIKNKTVSTSDTSTLPTALPVNNGSLKKDSFKVGNEAVSKKDFDYIVSNNFAGKLAIEGKSEQEVREYINDILTEESLILQSGEKLGLIKLDETIYNSTVKDLAKRKAAVSDLKKIIQNQYGLVTYSRISIWNYNIDPPQMGIEQAKAIAKSKMDRLHADLISNTISIEQASEQIKSEASLAQMDPVYKKNAFFRNTTSLDMLPEEIRSALSALEPNQYSPVSSMKGDSTEREEYFVILKLEERKGSGSYKDWLENAKQQFPITY